MTLPADPEDIASAVTLPTESPAIVIPAPIAGQVSIGEDVIKSVLSQVLGDSVDLTKVTLRVRINKGEWQLIDTSTGRVIALVLPAQTGDNQIEFEVTDADGEVIVVQRQVLVEGTPEAAAYTSELAADADGGSPWTWLLVALAGLGGVFLLGVTLRRRQRGQVDDEAPAAR